MHAHNFNNFQIRELTVSPCNFYCYVEEEKSAACESLCASGFSRPPPLKLSGELSSQAPYVTVSHTELGSPARPIVQAAADGKTRWCNIEVSLFGNIGKSNSQLKYSQPTSISDAHVLSWSILNISNNSWPIWPQNMKKRKKKKIARDHTICSCDNLIHAHTTTCGYVPISDRICMFTCTRNYLVSSLFYFRPLSRYALYYYIMAKNHVADNQTCVLCVVHCAVCACLKHDCLRVGLGIRWNFCLKIVRNFKKNRKISGSPQFWLRGVLSAHKKFGTIWVKTGGVIPEQTDKQRS